MLPMQLVYRNMQLLEKESMAKWIKQQQCTALTSRTENGEGLENALPAKKVQQITGTKSSQLSHQLSNSCVPAPSSSSLNIVIPQATFSLKCEGSSHMPIFHPASRHLISKSHGLSQAITPVALGIFSKKGEQTPNLFPFS